MELCYTDADMDGARSVTAVASFNVSCTGPGEADATAPLDCDDNDASLSPDAPEICDLRDNNCDGMIDEGCP